VGVVGSNTGSQQLIDHLTGAQPGGFDFHLYADEAAARSAIKDRDVYGAFIVTRQRISVLEASAASPAVAQLLTSIGQQLDIQHTLDGGQPVALSVVDVVPLSRDDPKGLVFSSSLLPLTICSILVAAAIGVMVRFGPAWRQLVALTVVSATAGLGSYLVAQSFLGALPHQAWGTWASLVLTILSMSAATTGLIALVGPAGLGLAAGLFVFVGNPFSGATSAPQLLPDPVNHIGQWLPPGAGANLLRSAAYFDGSDAAGHLSILVTWTLLGCAAVVVGHHRPIRFAAHPARSEPSASPRPHQPEHETEPPVRSIPADDVVSRDLAEHATELVAGRHENSPDHPRQMLAAEPATVPASTSADTTQAGTPQAG
jgi:hypothetical protein